MRTLVLIVIILSISIGFEIKAQKKYFNYRKTADSLTRQLTILEKLERSEKNDTLRANAYLKLAETHAGRDNTFAAIYADKALGFSQEIEYQKGIAEALLYIGLLDQEQLEGLDKAIESLEKSLKIYHELGYKDKMVELHRIIANFYYKIAFANVNNEINLRESLSHYQEALKLHIVLGDTLKAAEDYEKIGELHSYLQEDKEALVALRNAEDFRNAVGERNINNARLLAKYERIEELREEVQKSDTTRIIVIFCIIIAILVALLLVNIVRKKEAYKKLREHNIDVHSIDEGQVAVESEIGHKSKIKF